jgi:ribosomal protein S27AE
MIVNETKITLKMFCKTLNIPVPSTDNHESFMQNYVIQHNLNWIDLTEKIKKNKERTSNRRKERHKQLMEELRKADEKFFSEHGSADAKNRNCLKCNNVFFSPNGNRICFKCHKTNQEYIEGFHD